MGNSHPEDKVYQIGAPVDRCVHACHTHADNDLVGPAGSPHDGAAKQQGDHEPVGLSRTGQRVQDRGIDCLKGQLRHMFKTLN